MGWTSTAPLSGSWSKGASATKNWNEASAVPDPWKGLFDELQNLLTDETGEILREE